ncbi:hypothetical protein NQZ68_004549, partial [Dissostichus eleginoides]
EVPPPPPHCVSAQDPDRRCSDFKAAPYSRHRFTTHKQYNTQEKTVAPSLPPPPPSPVAKNSPLLPPLDCRRTEGYGSLCVSPAGSQGKPCGLATDIRDMALILGALQT